MTERVAACACGQLQIRCSGEPALVPLCHCVQCQRRTGSPFGVGAFFDAAVTAVSGASRSWRRTADSGHMVTFHFCETCGSNVYWYAAKLPDQIGVAVGCFADPQFPMPTLEAYGAQRHSWVADLMSCQAAEPAAQAPES